MIEKLFTIIGIIIGLILIFGLYFLIAYGAVALAVKCFEFSFAWKYVWFVWFILSFITPFFKGNSGENKNA